METTLTSAQQIIILEYAKNKLPIYECLCASIYHSIQDIYGNYILGIDLLRLDSLRLDYIIPSFDFNNVYLLCKNNNLELPVNKTYWWLLSNQDVRLKVFDLLIEDLRKLNKD